jgi:hypothetical protein
MLGLALADTACWVSLVELGQPYGDGNSGRSFCFWCPHGIFQKGFVAPKCTQADFSCDVEAAEVNQQDQKDLSPSGQQSRRIQPFGPRANANPPIFGAFDIVELIEK